MHNHRVLVFFSTVATLLNSGLSKCITSAQSQESRFTCRSNSTAAIPIRKLLSQLNLCFVVVEETYIWLEKPPSGNQTQFTEHCGETCKSSRCLRQHFIASLTTSSRIPRVVFGFQKESHCLSTGRFLVKHLVQVLRSIDIFVQARWAFVVSHNEGAFLLRCAGACYIEKGNI